MVLAGTYLLICVAMVLMGGPMPVGQPRAVVWVELDATSSGELDAVVRDFANQHGFYASMADIGGLSPTRVRTLYGLGATINGVSHADEGPRTRFVASRGGFFLGFPSSEPDTVALALRLCEALDARLPSSHVAAARGLPSNASTERPAGCDELRPE